MEFDLKDAKAKYSDLIAKLRAKLKDTSCFGIPMLRQLPPNERDYILLRLTSVNGSSVRLAINKNQVYVVGYSYTNGGKVFARFFRDIIKSEDYIGIFPEATNKDKENIGIEGSYPMLEGRAKARVYVPLGMKALGGLIDDISKTQQISNFPDPKTEAMLLLTAIQMVSEAVRFKYIENQVKGKIPENVYPDPKVISLEENWGAISTAIANANPGTYEFQNNVTVVLKNEEGKRWVVRSVTNIEKDMGLLNYAPGCKKKSKWLIKHLDDDVPVSAQ